METYEKDVLYKEMRESKSEDEQLYFWYFQNSSPNGKSSFNDKYIYCCCFNCCPGNLELKINNNRKKEDQFVIFCICFSLIYL